MNHHLALSLERGSRLPGGSNSLAVVYSRAEQYVEGSLFSKSPEGEESALCGENFVIPHKPVDC